MEAGRDMGIRNAGRFAVDCLRLERFVPRMGSELTPFTTPWEAGMKHMVNLHKVSFIDSYKHKVTNMDHDIPVGTKSF